MKSDEEIRKIAEELIPYNPYNETFFTGHRAAEIAGFVKGYKKALKDLEEKDKKNQLVFYRSWKSTTKKLVKS